MQYYLMPDLMQEKQVAINNLIEKKVQNEKEKAFQNGLALSGLFFSIIFGLPAICETFVIIRKIMYFVKRGDIPYITIKKISAITWMVLYINYRQEVI